MLELVVVGGLCLTHLSAPQLLRYVNRAIPDVAPVAHGLAVAFVFLHLLPEIGDGLAARGLALAWLLLLGFLAFNVAEARVRTSRHASVRQALQVGLAASLSWLLGASLPEAVNEHPAGAGLIFLAAALHMLESHHRGQEGRPLPAGVRVMVAGLVASGFVADERWLEQVEWLDQSLVALVGGGILTTVFRDHFELDVADRKLGVLCVAALTYGGVLTLAAA